MEYKEEEEESFGKKKSVSQLLIEYAWLWIPILAVIFLKGRMGEVGPYDKAVFASFMFILAGTILKLSYTLFYHYTPKLVYNNGFDTTDGRFVSVGNFVIIRRAIHAFAWYYRFKGPCYIAPIDGIERIGPNIVLNCDMEPVDISELPIEVRTYIRNNGLKPPFYFGLASPEQYTQTIEVKDAKLFGGLMRPNVSYLIDEIKKLNRQVDLRERVIRGDQRAIEEYVAGSSRIISRAKVSDISSTLKKIFGERE